MPAEILVTRDILAEDTLFVLQCLRENQREGRSMHMNDVRNYLASSVTLEFSDYLKFLRKFGYVVLDREQHTLALTPQGDRVAQVDPAGELFGQLEEFFAEKLKKGVVEVQSEEEERQSLASLVGTARPPPPPEDATPMPGPLPTFAFAADLAADPPPAGNDELIYLRGAPLGQGPHGTVYRAHHATLGTDIAIKELRDAATRKIIHDPAQLAGRLKSELAQQAKLHHPAIVGIYDLDLTVPQPFAVLELCGGGNLRGKLAAKPDAGLPADQVLRAFSQLLGGLAYAHAKGVTHHNLKAENILFDELGNAKLSDFGLGRLYQLQSDDGPAMVLDAAAVGYRAPELMQQGDAGPSADVYALGILLYEALTGHLPGRRSPLPSKVVAGLSADVDDLFDRMTADRPQERYETAADALEDLHAAFPDGRYGRPGTAFLLMAPPPPAKPAPAKAANEGGKKR